MKGGRIATTVVTVVALTAGAAAIAAVLRKDGPRDTTTSSSPEPNVQETLRGQLLIADLHGLRELSVDVGAADVAIRDARAVDVTDLGQSSSAVVQSPTFAPDGQRFAYVSSSDTSTDIMIGTTNGIGLYPLTQTASVRETGPTWSPDGAFIAYERTDESGKSEIWLADVESGGQYSVTKGSDTYLSPVWVPGSSRLVYVARSRTTGTSDLFSYDLATKTATRVTVEGDVNESLPAYSSDGEKLAFIASDPSDKESSDSPGEAVSSSIYMVDRNGTLSQLAVEAGNYLNVEWLSDGTLATVEFNSPGCIKAVPIAEPAHASEIWCGAGVASFDWRSVR